MIAVKRHVDRVMLEKFFGGLNNLDLGPLDIHFQEARHSELSARILEGERCYRDVLSRVSINGVVD